jgi:hypothetical protein
MSNGKNVLRILINAEWDIMSNSKNVNWRYCQIYDIRRMGLNVQFSTYVSVCAISIARQKIVKALMFNGQRILGLCESLNLNAVNFSKVSND